ncbi:YfbM family protein [Kitasatospora sp. NPDC088134]|uniref:YfbM family protein n=1 Tax=Kitasatospora sp. NPDC088134 TaxID=3364071 RepID=UPI0037FDDF7F
MACRGVLFALTDEESAALLAAAGDEEVTALVAEIEEAWAEGRVCELDKSWDALHRCLTDGELAFDNGGFPLSHVILGGRPLTGGEDWLVCHVTAEQVRAVAEALAAVDEPWLRRRYFGFDFPDYDGEHGESDLQYTAAFLPDLHAFYRRAAAEGRAVVFTVDQ